MMGNEIIDILADAVKQVSGSVEVVFTDYKGMPQEKTPQINYLFGSAEYFKDYLDESAKVGKQIRFPMIVLFCPVTEKRDNPELYTKANVNLLIVCNTRKEWSNEQRKKYSFENVLRPIYHRLLDVLLSDNRLDFTYRSFVKHEYSENYSYGKYGAYVERSGEMVSEPIDAIDIRNLELKVNKLTCR